MSRETSSKPGMSRPVIAILDEDHVLRLAAWGLSPRAPETDRSIRDFFAPEDIDPALLAEAAAGLSAPDGCALRLPAGGKPPPIADADVVLFRRGAITAATLAAAPRLKLIQRLGARSDGIDLAAAQAAGVAVSCLPRQTLAFTAEHAILLMLALAKRLVAADQVTRSGSYDPARVRPVDAVAYNWPGLASVGGLYGRTLGIIGLGEVGALVARQAQGFGMTVLYTKRTPLTPEQEQAYGVSYRPFEALVAEADFVSLNASNIGPNDKLIGRAVLSAMKPTAFFINTSRGRLVDEDALYDALASGTIAGAGLDVHRTEPRPKGDRFAALPNVILTPHIAGGSRMALINEMAQIYDNIRAVAAGAPPPHGRVTPLAS